MRNREEGGQVGAYREGRSGKGGAAPARVRQCVEVANRPCPSCPIPGCLPMQAFFKREYNSVFTAIGRVQSGCRECPAVVCGAKVREAAEGRWKVLRRAHGCAPPAAVVVVMCSRGVARQRSVVMPTARGNANATKPVFATAKSVKGACYGHSVCGSPYGEVGNMAGRRSGECSGG